MEKHEIRKIILEVIAESLEAQAKAVRSLTKPVPKKLRAEKGRSQVDMAYDILHRAGHPLHISEIISRIEQVFGVSLDRESLVSALSKKVARGDRFVRTGKNTFSLVAEVR
jgi:hypothetical protein